MTGIPEHIDCLKLIAELNSVGWRDYKIELALNLATGHIASIKSARIKNPRYDVAAKLFNLHARYVPRETELNQSASVPE